MTKEDMRERAFQLGFSSFGVTSAEYQPRIGFYEEWLRKGYAGEMEYLTSHLPLKSSVRNLLPNCRSVLAVTLDYNTEPGWRQGYPKIARYALGRDYHKVIRSKLKSLARFLQSQIPAAEYKVCVDSAAILEREFALQAGLGWFGKNTCLIDSRRGSWFFIGLILTSHEFPPDVPSLGSCGSCTKCIEACPTGAIVYESERWQVNATKCISYITIEQHSSVEEAFLDKLEGWTFGCDICQEVCPFNSPRETQPNRGAFATETDFLAHRKWPSLDDLRLIDEQRWDELTRGSAVRRSGWARLKQIATINLKADAGERSGCKEQP